MYRKTPRSLALVGKEILPTLLGATSGRRMLDMVARIIETDKIVITINAINQKGELITIT